MPELVLKGWMAAHRVKNKEIAELLGISQQSVSKKLNGYEDFSMAQARLIVQHYGVSADIFLPR